MKTIHSFIYILSILVLGIALSCGGGSGATEANTVDLGAPAQGPKTSSDMNISPANMQTEDPMYHGNDTLSRADSLRLNKPND